MSKLTAKLLVVLFLACAAPAAAQIAVPNTFVNGTAANADDVNANFAALANNALNRTAGTMTGVLTLTTGTAAAPGLIGAAVGTGLTLDTAAIGFAITGTQRLHLDATGLTLDSGVLTVPTGTAGNPGLVGSSATTGTTMGAGTIGWSLGGTQRLLLNGSGLTAYGTVIVDNAGVSPTFAALAAANVFTANKQTFITPAGQTAIEVRGRSADNTTVVALKSNDGVTSYGFIQSGPADMFFGSFVNAPVHLYVNSAPQVDLPITGGLTIAAVLFAALGTPASGTVVYCSDCVIANPCAGAGSGALAKRLNGAWVCN